MELYKKPNRSKYAPNCPCGKSNSDNKFVPFILDGVPSSQYGYCHSCGKSFYPKNNKVIEPKLFIEPKREFKTIQTHIFQTTINHFDTNIFTVWLIDTFQDKAKNAIEMYKIGTRSLYQTIFWYADFKQQIRNGKLFSYSIDGKRNKKYAPKLLFTREDGYTLCLFGEHLLSINNYAKTVILVESEKTAIVGSIVFEDYIWIATGGANALTKSKAQILKYRKVIILPDCDDAGRKGAERNLKILNEVNCNASISSMGNELTSGEDLVDIIISNKSF